MNRHESMVRLDELERAADSRTLTDEENSEADRLSDFLHFGGSIEKGKS